MHEDFHGLLGFLPPFVDPRGRGVERFEQEHQGVFHAEIPALGVDDEVEVGVWDLVGLGLQGSGVDVGMQMDREEKWAVPLRGEALVDGNGSGRLRGRCKGRGE